MPGYDHDKTNDDMQGKAQPPARGQSEQGGAGGQGGMGSGAGGMAYGQAGTGSATGTGMSTGTDADTERDMGQGPDYGTGGGSPSDQMMGDTSSSATGGTEGAEITGATPRSDERSKEDDEQTR